MTLEQEQKKIISKRSVITEEVTDADYDPELRSAQAMGALALLFGMLGLCLLPFGFIRFHPGSFTGRAFVDYLGTPLRATTSNALWMLSSAIAGSGLALILFIGGIGLIRLKWWGRALVLAWSVLTIIFGGAGAYFFYAPWLAPATRDQFAEVRGVIDSLVIFWGVGSGMLLALGFLAVLTRRNIATYFRARRTA